MSGSKYFNRVAVLVTILMLAITVLFIHGDAIGINVMPRTMGYEHRLFDNTQVHTIDIVMNNWDDFISNAESEEYCNTDVIIDGEAYKNVGIRAKGNTSLSTVKTLGSERYSFKIEFDHYDKTASYHGLDKLSLNNLIQDSTMMKDYLTYTMMNEFGISSSLCSYVYITVNGEDWGLYLAVEGIEESFLERNYGIDYGKLYKPDSMNFGGGRGNGKDFEFDHLSMPDDDREQGSHTENSVMNKKNGGSGSFGSETGMASADVKLQYTDDELDSYSNIWNNAKTVITEADQKRLIEALKKLSDNEELASAIDIEQVIRYFVVHNYVCNGDSYTGSMVHNYYLYEQDGRLTMLPWDYNLAFGTFQSSNANSTVNAPIDSPVNGSSGEDRPMWYWIIANEEYTELYHQYFAEFLSSMNIESIIDNAYALIKDYVAKDPTAFYSYDEFELGVKTLRQFCVLRSKSISKQFESGETTQDMGFIDASVITLSDMGSMGGSKNDDTSHSIKDDKSGSHNNVDMHNINNDTWNNGAGSKLKNYNIDSSDIYDSRRNNGIHSQGSDNQNMENQPPAMPEFNNAPPNFDDTKIENLPMPDNSISYGDKKFDAGFSPDMQRPLSSSSDMTAWIWIAVSVAFLSVGLFIVKKYKL